MVELSDSIKIDKENIYMTQDFNCGNDVMNEWLKNKSHKDTQAVTYIVKNLKNNDIVCYYSLCCFGFVINSKGHYIIYPAVEIKMFATDEKYQHISYSGDPEEGTVSDTVFNHVVGKIYDFTDNVCGADKVILYAVPEAENFYKKNGFERFQNFMLQSESRFIDGCIPMYMSL